MMIPHISIADLKKFCRSEWAMRVHGVTSFRISDPEAKTKEKTNKISESCNPHPLLERESKGEM